MERERKRLEERKQKCQKTPQDKLPRAVGAFLQSLNRACNMFTESVRLCKYILYIYEGLHLSRETSSDMRR